MAKTTDNSTDDLIVRMGTVGCWLFSSSSHFSVAQKTAARLSCRPKKSGVIRESEMVRQGSGQRFHERECRGD
jgi:hypothetical protein